MLRKILPLSMLFLCSLLLILVFIVPALAQEEGFIESFDDPLLPGWEHAPEVIVSEGTLRIGPGNFAARLGAWQDFDLSFRISFEGQGESEVQYHATDAGTYILVFSPGQLVLRKGGPGLEPSELARADWSEEPPTGWITVRITLSGSLSSVYIEEALQLTADDPEPLPAGGLVFASQGDRTTVLDDLSLTVPSPEPGTGEPHLPAATQEVAPLAGQEGPTTWESLVQSLSSTQGAMFDPWTFVINLLLAVVSSFILGRVYVFWGASLSNRRKFAANFMLVTVTTTFIILVVRSSVALSLGLVGALSIIRFRAAIKEPEELAYIFFAISLGIGLGDNQRLVTLVTLAVVILVLGLARLLRQSQADVNLNLTITSRAPNKLGMPQVMEALQQHCAKLRLLRFDENPEALEMSFIIEFKHTTDLERARSALLALGSAIEISFMDNRGVW